MRAAAASAVAFVFPLSTAARNCGVSVELYPSPMVIFMNDGNCLSVISGMSCFILVCTLLVLNL